MTFYRGTYLNSETILQKNLQPWRYLVIINTDLNII